MRIRLESTPYGIIYLHIGADKFELTLDEASELCAKLGFELQEAEEAYHEFMLKHVD